MSDMLETEVDPFFDLLDMVDWMNGRVNEMWNVECEMHVLAPLLTPHSSLPSPLPFHPSPPLLSLPTLLTLSFLFPVPFPTLPPSSLPLPIPLTTTAIIITHSHHTSCHAMEWIYDIFIMDDSFLFFDHVTHWPCHTMSYYVILDHTRSHYIILDHTGSYASNIWLVYIEW